MMTKETGHRNNQSRYYATSSSSSIPLVHSTNVISTFQHTNNTANSYNPNNATNKHPHHPAKSLQQQSQAFLALSTPYFQTSSSAKRLFFTLLLLTLLNSGIRVYFSYLSRDFWNALSEKNVNQFYSVMWTFMGAMVGLTPISVAYRYVRQMLAIDWRDWMTGRVLGLFFRKRAYYALERCYGGNHSSDDGGVNNEWNPATNNATANTKSTATVDNPDQRIAEDIRSFTEFSLSLFLTTLTAIIDLICFSFLLASIMPRLFLAIFLFATSGTLLTVWIGKKLIGLNYEGLQKEADFRFALVRIRENAESIAFYCGEEGERRETEWRFGRVIENMG